MLSPTRDMVSEPQHQELIVELDPGADRDAVAAWLRRKGFDVMPLVVGLLAIGDAAAVRAAFGADAQGALPPPEELRPHVRSVMVAPPKQWHGDA